MVDEFISDVVAACEAGVRADRSQLGFLLGKPATDDQVQSDDDAQIERLTSYIYGTYHCRSPEGGGNRPELGRPEASHLLIEECVRAAYEERIGPGYYLEAGFEAIDREGPWPRRFAKDGLVLRCDEDEVEHDRGPFFSLRFPRCLPYRSRGFISFAGKHGPVAADTGVLRLYFALDYEGSLAAAEAFCNHADAAGRRYLLKTIGKSSGYLRTDNMVAYIDHNEFRNFRPILNAISSENEATVVHGRPSIFCKPIGSGISLAEEPNQTNVGESFGLHRSRLLAEATVRFLGRSDDVSGDALEGAIRSRFSQDDVSVKLPYLSYSWADAYE